MNPRRWFETAVSKTRKGNLDTTQEQLLTNILTGSGETSEVARLSAKDVLRACGDDLTTLPDKEIALLTTLRGMGPSRCTRTISLGLLLDSYTQPLLERIEALEAQHNQTNQRQTA